MSCRGPAWVTIVLGIVVATWQFDGAGDWQVAAVAATCNAKGPKETDKQDDKPAEERGTLPPLTVNKDNPLLLEDKPAKHKMKVDNSACYVCHTNYEEEPLVIVHGENEVGCADCHGESLDHCDDEDNITPPELMYPREKINRACEDCHDTHDVPAKDVLALWRKRCPEQTDPKKIVCTDCHGKHRLEKRVVRWNKRTRALILREVAEAPK